MSDTELILKSTIHDQQLNYLIEQAKKELQSVSSKEEVQLIISQYYKQYLENLGQPLYKRQQFYRGQLPYKEEFERLMTEVIADLNIMYNEHNNASDFMVDSYNFMQSEKKRLTSQINGLNSLVGDLYLMTNETDSKTIYFKESFDNPKNLDTEFQLEGVSSAQVSSSEGVLTLARTMTENVSEKASIGLVTGNGTAGTEHIARRIQLEDENGQLVSTYIFLNENEALKNNQPDVVLDGRSDTIFEYQMVNVPDSFIHQHKGYDFEWVKGNPSGDNLRLKMVVELDKEQMINWINVNPYYPTNSTNRMKVYSIRTSKDGLDYQGLFEETDYVLDKEINDTPQTYDVSDLFDTTNEFSEAKYTGQGVWGFPARSARFVEFVFDQPDHYPEIIGQEVYYVRTKEADYWTQIPKVEELIGQPAGEYARAINGEQVVYKKEIVATTEGWRYGIGLRDLNIMSYRFAEGSSFVSKRYDINGEISKVMLYAREKIPAEFLTTISTSNDWVKYEVSFDDMTWYRLSPMHHEPVNDQFPAKILELNGSEIDLASAFQVHKQLIQTQEPPTHIRFKITLSRPEGDVFQTLTPLVEDVALRIQKKEVSL